MIEIKNVTFEYAGGTKALNDVSTEFPRGVISAVLGESGSGKTTLLMCLGQFLEPQQGSITYDNKNIYEIPELEYRKSIGIVFQKLYLFPHLTILQNMTLAPVKAYKRSMKESEEESMLILQRLGIEEIAESYPSQVSGGQAQRAAIARGLILRPDYMLLDEPTSALDANTTDEFAQWLVELKEETNFIIVTHDILFARRAATTGVYLTEGKVADKGDINDIVSHLHISENI